MDQKGQILVESIVGITVGVIALTGVLSLLTSSLGINKDIGRRFTASFLAGEGVEVVKGMIDENYAQGQAWNAGLSDGAYEVEYDTSDPNSARFSGNPDDMSSRPIFFNENTGFYSYESIGTQTGYTRTVQITNIDRGGGSESDEIKVKAIVEWEERGGDQRSIVMEDHFFDWRP